MWVLRQNPYGNIAARHRDHLVSQKRHVFFRSQGYIVKLELENYALSGAVLKTLPHIFILIHFLLNYTEHFLGALTSTTISLKLPTLKKEHHPVHPG